MHRGRTGALGPGGFEGLLPYFNDVAELEIRQASSPAVTPLWRETSARLGAWIDAPNSAAAPSDFIARLAPSSQQFLRNKFGERGYQEFSDLLRERDPKIYLHQMWQFGRRLREENRLEAAAWVFQNVAEMSEVVSVSPEISVQARGDLKLMMGQGPWGRVLVSQAERILEESWDPSMVVGFGVASAAYKLTRFFSLAKILSRPGLRFALGEWGAQALASSVALGVEAPMFVAAAKGTHELLGVRQNWEVEGLWREVQATGLTLLFLKGFGAASEKVFQSMHGIDPLRPAVARFSAFTRFSQVAVPQAGMYLGILLSQEAERRLGWRAPSEALHPFAEALLTWGQFHLGGAVADRAWGHSFKSWQRRLDLMASELPQTSFLGPMPVQASPLLGSGPTELLGPSILLSENHDGSAGPRKGKLISLFPGGSARPRDAGSPPKWTPAELAKAAKAQEVSAERLLGDFHRFVATMNFQVLVYLGHLQRGRGGIPQVTEVSKQILDAERGLYETFFEAQKAHRQLSSLSFVSSQDPEAYASVQRSRSRLAHMLGVAKSLHESLKPLLSALLSNDPVQIYRVVESFPNAPSPRVDSIGLVQAMSQWVHENNLLGMLRGTVIKDLFRGSEEEMQFLITENFTDQKPLPLPPGENPGAELRTLHSIARSLIGPGNSEKNYFNHFMARPLDGERSWGAREVLRWGGEAERPFASWVSLYVPMLLAFNGGDFSKFLERIAPLELLMPQETWMAGRASAWWLSRALRAEKSPRYWEQDLLSETRLPAFSRVLSRRALALAKRGSDDPKEAALWLGEQGDLAAWAHGLAAFVRHPFDPRLAMERALSAPSAVREDAASVTGALLGAFNGKAKFSPEFFEDVVGRFVLGRSAQSPHLAGLFRDQSYIATVMDELLPALRGAAGASRVQRLTPVPPVSPWEAVRDSFESAFGERLADFQRSAQECARCLGDFQDNVASKTDEPSQVIQLRQDYDEMNRFVKVSERRLKALNAAWIPQGYFEPYRLKIRAAQRVRDRLSAAAARFAGASASERPTIQHWVQQQIRVALRTMEARDTRAAGAVEPVFHPALQRAEVLRLQTALQPIGKSSPPKNVGSFFGNRSDQELSQFIVNRFQGMLPEPPAGVENLLEVYLLAIGGKVTRDPHRSLSEQVSLSGMLSVVLPAYLELNREHPASIYQELKTLSPLAGSKIRESWRAVAYLTLRVLEGAKPDDVLLKETWQFLGETPMGRRLRRLWEMRRDVDPKLHFLLQRTWEISKDPRDQVLSGIHAWLKAPDDFNAALRAAAKISGDPEKNPERVVALLLGAAGHLPQKHRAEEMGVLYFLRKPSHPGEAVNDRESTPIDPTVDPHAWDRHLIDFYAQWLQARAATGISAENLRDALAPMPGYFVSDLSIMALRDPLLAKCLMVGFDLVDPQSFLSKDPEVRHELTRRSGESLAPAEFDELADKVTHLFRHNAPLYFPDQYQASQIRDAELKVKLAQVPPIFLKALGDVERSPAQFLFLMHHFKLSDFGYPNYESLPE